MTAEEFWTEEGFDLIEELETHLVAFADWAGDRKECQTTKRIAQLLKRELFDLRGSQLFEDD